MYKVIKAVIESKRYELEDMLNKLDTFWVQGRISEAEYTELVALAREKALPENSYAGAQERIDALFKEIVELKERVRVLESAKDESTGDEPTEENPEEPIPDDYPAYVAPTGAHDAYMAGAKVTYNGVRYVCVAPEGVAVVWNPDVMPSYWQEVTDVVETTEDVE